MNFSDIAILNIKNADFCCIISGISKSPARNLMQNTDLTEKKCNIIEYKNLFSYIKMVKETLRFGNIEIKKSIFHRYKSPIFKKDVDIEKVSVYNKISSSGKSYKYFIGYLQNDQVKPVYIMLPKTSAHVKSYEGKTK